ncbi:MAG: 2-oxoglutarate dehydrogenase, E2 component, dihydrolipoamide succinyltransferase, partial [Planctomycetaceae bacterium]
GEVVRISEIAAEITEITARHVLLKDPAGIWKLVLGGTLRERVLEVPAEPTVAGAAAETETVSGAADAVVAPKPAPAAEEPVVPQGTPAPATPVTPAPADPAAPATPVSPDPAAPAEPPAPAAPPAPAVPTTG